MNHIETLKNALCDRFGLDDNMSFRQVRSAFEYVGGHRNTLCNRKSFHNASFEKYSYNNDIEGTIPGIAHVCGCGHSPIKDQCYIRHIHSGEIVLVGNVCINLFIGKNKAMCPQCNEMHSDYSKKPFRFDEHYNRVIGFCNSCLQDNPEMAQFDIDFIAPGSEDDYSESDESGVEESGSGESGGEESDEEESDEEESDDDSSQSNPFALVSSLYDSSEPESSESESSDSEEITLVPGKYYKMLFDDIELGKGKYVFKLLKICHGRKYVAQFASHDECKQTHNITIENDLEYSSAEEYQEQVSFFEDGDFNCHIEKTVRRKELTYEEMEINVAIARSMITLKEDKKRYKEFCSDDGVDRPRKRRKFVIYDDDEDLD